MSLPSATKLIANELIKEINWRKLCEKAGIDPKETKVYDPKELKEKSKDTSI